MVDGAERSARRSLAWHLGYSGDPMTYEDSVTYSHVNVKMLTRGGLCAYAGCECHWQVERISAGGFRIGYCAEHERRARLLFGANRVTSLHRPLKATA
jgi:hypothetical protein